MADRIIATFLLAVSLGYAFIAFTILKAPFQYDPLGPEAWPQILSCVAILCLAYILWKPDDIKLDVTRYVWVRLAGAVTMLWAYGKTYEPLGFILSTAVFGTLMAWMLGASKTRASTFGFAAGILGWLICVTLMDLNLPLGDLIEAGLKMFERGA
ncbi:tripartite tricarboxylate transporter TctB family protein [Celeribacter sp.]|uniref:tripartite tricarboxylate transporter TctB family protein n=1 Tax=Celeribacter sp. TaxID=1890673 RepID=UPI003A8E0016